MSYLRQKTVLGERGSSQPQIPQMELVSPSAVCTAMTRGTEFVNGVKHGELEKCIEEISNSSTT
jgi:hypothetical protein